MIVIEVMLDALARIPGGASALAAACSDRAGRRPPSGEDGEVDLAAASLALALIDAARASDRRAG